VNPALRERLHEHRLVRQSELYELAALLDTYDLTPDSGPLRDAGSLCLGATRTAHPDALDAGRTYWGYRIEGLQLRLGKQRHCRPRAAEGESLVGILSVEVEEYLPEEIGAVGDSFDHIRRLDARFRCDTQAILEGSAHQLRAAWHVDTHLHTAEASSAVHPRFHFQSGGTEMAEVDHAIRGALLLEAPRPALAPLDGILAIDFVLSHYHGPIWEDLRLMDPRYARLRAPSMRRYWGPYFRLLAEALEGEDAVEQGSRAAHLLPNLVTS